jgi:hypothetical protein
VVIITYAGDLPSIREQIAHASREPALIPVLQRGDQDAMRNSTRSRNEDANLNQFPKTTNRR